LERHRVRSKSLLSVDTEPAIEWLFSGIVRLVGRTLPMIGVMIGIFTIAVFPFSAACDIFCKMFEYLLR